jgi:hypothetical protein
MSTESKGDRSGATSRASRGGEDAEGDERDLLTKAIIKPGYYPPYLFLMVGVMTMTMMMV